VPALVTDRFARLNHGYEGADCSSFTSSDARPSACRMGSQDAQNMSAFSSFLSNGLTFFTSAMIGSISDHHGRRPVLILGMGLACVSPLCLVLLHVFPHMHPGWYYLASGFNGLVNWFAVALSALSDVMPPKWRAPSFGLILAGFSMGFALSPMLALAFDHTSISIFSSVLVFATFLFAFFFYPETLPPHVQVASKERAKREEDEFLMRSSRFLPVGSLSNAPSRNQRIVHNLCRPARELSILNRSYIFRLLSCLAFFSGMVGSADQSLLVYYAEDELNFNDKDVATMFSIMGIMGMVVQGLILKPLNESVGERKILIVAFIFGVIHNIIYGLATKKYELFVAVALGSVLMMSFPTISAIKSINVTEHEQGRIQGALYSLSALASAVGPLSLRAVYVATINSGIPGFMFLFASLLYVVAVICAYLLPLELSDSRLKSQQVDASDDSISISDSQQRREFMLGVSLPKMDQIDLDSRTLDLSYGSVDSLETPLVQQVQYSPRRTSQDPSV
jgi:DHA1 family tetracycline resistance protein-like MFS transporter